MYSYGLSFRKSKVSMNSPTRQGPEVLKNETDERNESKLAFLFPLKFIISEQGAEGVAQFRRASRLIRI